MSFLNPNEPKGPYRYSSDLPAASSAKPNSKEPTEFTIPMNNGGDISFFPHSENERLRHHIRKLEEEIKALGRSLTSSHRETRAAIVDKERIEVKYIELLQHERNSEPQTATLPTQQQQESRTIMHLEAKLDKRRDENSKLKEDNASLIAKNEEINASLLEKTKMVTQLEAKLDKRRDENSKLKEDNASLTARIKGTHASLLEKTNTITQLEENLVSLGTDLQVYAYFTRIGISLRHRALELEHVPSEQDQNLIDEGNKVSRSSACLADAQLYHTRRYNAVPLMQQSHLSILLGEPRRDQHIYRRFYGSSPDNVVNFADVEEFVQMVDYRGAMFKFLGQAQYAQSRFAVLVKEMSELIHGKGREETRNAFRSERGQQILFEMGCLYNEAAREYSHSRV